ncbi:MAG: chorismate mutase [Spirochaetales bacterium]|nr:chorismate mutase [Spirochaetales bacterium]
MNLDSLRARIDELDSRLVATLAERQALALLTGRFKNAVRDPARERAVLDRLTTLAEEPLDAGFIEALYALIMGHSRSLQETGRVCVGYVGPRDRARAVMADLRPEAVLIPVADADEALAELDEGKLDGVLVVSTEATLSAPGTTRVLRGPAGAWSFYQRSSYAPA